MTTLKLDEALLALPVLEADVTPRGASIRQLQTILDYMRAEGLDKIADRPLFFADLYERRQLSLLLDAASVAQTETREHALLVIYACERRKYVGVDMFGVCLTGQSAAAALAYKPHPVPSILDTLQDDDSRYLLESLAKGGRYAWTDLPAHDALQGIVVGLVRWLRRKQRATPATAADGGGERPQHGDGDSQRVGIVGRLKEFEEQFTLIATSFDCANFFYAVLAERSRAKAFANNDIAMADFHCDYYAKHEKKLDPTHMYAEIWNIIRKETIYSERVFYVAHSMYCTEPSRLTLLRRHGLFPTMMSLCQHMHLRDMIFTYSNRRVNQILSRLQHGTSFDATNVVDAVQHVFAMAAAIQKWCDYIDAAYGGIGEGAVRLCGALYAATSPPRLPIAGKDPSFFFALEQLRASRALLTTAVLVPSNVTPPPAHATVSRNGVTYGTHKFRLFVYFLPPTVASAASALPTDRPSATMTVLARFPSSQSYFDDMLCCLYETFGRLSANCGDTRYERPFHNLAGMLEDFCREDCASLAQRARQACIFAAESAQKNGTLIDALEPRWCAKRSQDAAAAAAPTAAPAGVERNFSRTRKLPPADKRLWQIKKINQ